MASQHSATSIDVGISRRYSGIYLSNAGINVTFINLTCFVCLVLSFVSRPRCPIAPVQSGTLGDEIFHRWSSLALLFTPDRSTSNKFIMNIYLYYRYRCFQAATPCSLVYAAYDVMCDFVSWGVHLHIFPVN